jgi:hypothetical protein
MMQIFSGSLIRIFEKPGRKLQPVAQNKLKNLSPTLTQEIVFTGIG